MQVHLSKFAEDLIIWNTQEFAFVKMADAYATGSSLMPQKKNPDALELLRGKASRQIGHTMTLLTMLKGTPTAYNKDNQEDKEPLFDSVDTVLDALRAFADMVPAIEPNADAMRAAALRGFATATDLADYLVRRGLPFRDAHEVVGKAVAHGLETGRDLAEMDLETLRRFSTSIDDDVFAVLTLEGSVAAREHIGGTAPVEVRAAAGRALARVEARVKQG